MAEPTNTPIPPGTPVPASTPRSTSPTPLVSHAMHKKRPVVLHIGDPVKYNPTTYAAFSAAFDIIRPTAEERERGAFMRALRERRWGDFDAVFRPFWGTGGEMGRWDAELIELLPYSVKIFASAGAGFDWADTKLLGEKGILYCNSGLAAAESVADFAVAMVISTFRVLPWCMHAATLPFFTHASPEEATRIFQMCHAQATVASHNPRNHVLGLIGLGNIGQKVAGKLGNAAFGMHIAYHDVERKSPAVEGALGATFHTTLSSLMRASDCVVLCTPAAPDGRPLITAAILAAMRPGTRFVNIARGSLVDETALADALDAGIVSTAALDVHADEPRVHPRLIKMAGLEGAIPGRVMLTCHNAGGTVETHEGFEELSMRNIMAVLQGHDPITPVNTHWLKPKI